MESSKNYLLLAVILAMTASAAFFIGYSFQKQGIDPQQINYPNFDLQFKQVENKISSLEKHLINKLNESNSKIIEIANTINSLSKENQLLKTELQNKEFNNLPKTIDSKIAQKEVPIGNQTSKERMEQIVDLDIAKQAANKLKNSNITLSEREKNLKALLVIGSSEVKWIIGELIFDQSENISLRQTAITELNWEGAGDKLLELFQSDKDNGIRNSVIYAARNSALTEQERQPFEQTLTDNFMVEQDEAVQMSTLDYFALQTKDKNKFENLVNSVPFSRFSPELTKHIDFLRQQGFPPTM